MPSCCAAPLTAPVLWSAMPNKLGKRYACDVCGAVYLVVKPGAGSIECHGQSADEQVAKQLPSSD